MSKKSQDASVGGNTITAPTRPVRGERWYECPITGIEFPESEGVWSRGKRVHKKAVDAPGYREQIEEPSIDDAPAPGDYDSLFSDF